MAKFCTIQELEACIISCFPSADIDRHPSWAEQRDTEVNWKPSPCPPGVSVWTSRCILLISASQKEWEGGS